MRRSRSARWRAARTPRASACARRSRCSTWRATIRRSRARRAARARAVREARQVSGHGAVRQCRIHVQSGFRGGRPRDVVLGRSAGRRVRARPEAARFLDEQRHHVSDQRRARLCRLHAGRCPASVAREAEGVVLVALQGTPRHSTPPRSSPKKQQRVATDALPGHALLEHRAVSARRRPGDQVFGHTARAGHAGRRWSRAANVLRDELVAHVNGGGRCARSTSACSCSTPSA